MSAPLMAAGSALAVWAGMAVLCFRSSSQRHRLGLRELTAREQWRFITAAMVLFAISLAAAIATDGVQFGLLLWPCQAGVLGLALICLLPFARTVVTASAWVTAVLGPLLLAAGVSVI